MSRNKSAEGKPILTTSKATALLLFAIMLTGCSNTAELKLEPMQQKEIISHYRINESEFKMMEEFNPYITIANNQKHATNTLMILEYETYGFKDIFTSREYTIMVARNGSVQGVMEGLHDPDVWVKGNIYLLRDMIKNNDYTQLESHLSMSPNLRIKLTTLKIKGDV
jgi:hypothetical protein